MADKETYWDNKYCCFKCKGELEKDGIWKVCTVPDILYDEKCCVCGKSPTKKLTLIARI